jgi:hypothetical protein
MSQRLVSKRSIFIQAIACQIALPAIASEPPILASFDTAVSLDTESELSRPTTVVPISEQQIEDAIAMPDQDAIAPTHLGNQQSAPPATSLLPQPESAKSYSLVPLTKASAPVAFSPNQILIEPAIEPAIEILYYKARGNQPLVGNGSSVTQAQSQPLTESIDRGSGPNVPVETVAVRSEAPSEAPSGERSEDLLEVVRNAWQYFKVNHQKTGLVKDRSDLNGVTLWGIWVNV